MSFHIGEAVTSDNRLPVDLGLQAAPPSISELNYVDTSTKLIVVRRTLVRADGTISVGFVDLLGNAVTPNPANLALPVTQNTDGTVMAVASTGLLKLSLDTFAGW